MKPISSHPQPTGVGGRPTDTVLGSTVNDPTHFNVDEGSGTFPAAPGVAPLPPGDQFAAYGEATSRPIHATGGTLGQSLDETQRALVAGETHSRLPTRAIIELWISESHMTQPPSDSVHWTTHLQSRIPLLVEQLGG